MIPFDIFITSAPKDYIKLPYVVKSIINNIKGFNNIYIVTPDKVSFKTNLPIISYKDEEILPNINPYNWKFRPFWIYQQFIKLFQNVTKNDYYLIVDSDVIINKPLNIFEDDHPIWYVSQDQNEQQYFNFSQQMIGIGKIFNRSFISDMGFMNKKIIQDMLVRNNLTFESFLNKSYDITSVTCHISEYELYGNYCSKYFSDLYKIKNIKSIEFGKRQFGNESIVWTKEELENIIEIRKQEECDIFSLHTWAMDTRSIK